MGLHEEVGDREPSLGARDAMLAAASLNRRDESRRRRGKERMAHRMLQI